MAATHVYESPPEGAQPDWTVPQNWERITAADHAVWDRLFARQAAAVEGMACDAFLAGLDLLRLPEPGIPDLAQLNLRLRAATGWEIVPVPGVIPNEPFFRHLSQRRFPAANFLRAATSLDYSEEPDLFHDLFGHVPMLADPMFADFLVAYGNAGLRVEGLDAVDQLGRLYLHTVEFGLVREHGALRVYGAGLQSSYSETVHALTAPDVRRIEFDLARVMQSDYLFDEFQRSYFVITSFADLLQVTAQTDFQPIYDRLRDQPLLASGAASAGDRLVPLTADIGAVPGRD